MDKPLILDLFCGPGGAGEGYHGAGLDPVGCDLDPKMLRHNPHECYQGDAFEVMATLLAGGRWHGYVLTDFAAIHASPKCQHDSIISRNLGYANRHERQVDRVRPLLMQTGLPWVMENVEGAPMLNPITLCGSHFGLGIPEFGWYLKRHRLFESNVLLFASGPCRHHGMAVSICGNGTPKYTRDRCGRAVGIAEKRRLMGIEWMTHHEIAQAIPPAYTAWIGAQLMNVINADRLTLAALRGA